MRCENKLKKEKVMKNNKIFYAVVSTFQRNQKKRRLVAATSYLAGDTDTDNTRVVEYSNFIAVVQGFATLDEAYHNVAQLKQGKAVFNTDTRRIIQN